MLAPCIPGQPWPLFFLLPSSPPFLPSHLQAAPQTLAHLLALPGSHRDLPSKNCPGDHSYCAYPPPSRGCSCLMRPRKCPDQACFSPAECLCTGLESTPIHYPVITDEPPKSPIPQQFPKYPKRSHLQNKTGRGHPTMLGKDNMGDTYFVFSPFFIVVMLLFI